MRTKRSKSDRPTLPTKSWRPVLTRSALSLIFGTLWQRRLLRRPSAISSPRCAPANSVLPLDILGTISFVLGVVFAIMAVMAMIKRSRNTNDRSVESGRILMLSVAAACMVAIPTFLNVGVASIFGTGANQSSVDGPLRSLN